MGTMKKSEQKMAMREQAKLKVKPYLANVGADRGYREKVEAGRDHLMRASAEGGDTQTKKIKSELTYLLNNYIPSNDTRIEGLIDAWRRSGDPGYDPSIRTKLRQARVKSQNHSSAI